MGSWNFRVVKTKLNEEEDSYDICEVHYNDEYKPISSSIDKNVLSHDSLKDLKWCYEEIQKAFEKPIIENTANGLIELILPSE
jgi:hypothetical protein